MKFVEHEVLVVVQVCESKRGRRRSSVVGVVDGVDGGDERRALSQAANACGSIIFADDRDEWIATGYVQRVRLRLPVLDEPLRTITIEGRGASTTKRRSNRR